MQAHYKLPPIALHAVHHCNVVQFCFCFDIDVNAGCTQLKGHGMLKREFNSKGSYIIPVLVALTIVVDHAFKKSYSHAMK